MSWFRDIEFYMVMSHKSAKYGKFVALAFQRFKLENSTYDDKCNERKTNRIVKMVVERQKKKTDKTSDSRLRKIDDYAKDGGEELFTKMHCVLTTNP